MGQEESKPAVPEQGPKIEDSYHIQKVNLGKGSFATVWRAVQRESGNMVAVKQVNKNLMKRKGMTKPILEREVQMMQQCSHANILSVHDIFEDSVNFNVVLDYCNGGDLGDKIKEREAPISQVIDWSAQMLSAVVYLHHGLGTLHLDIKPDNFLLIIKESGRMIVKLSDFGLATTATGRLSEKCGTPAFMSPELHQISSQGYYFNVDCWAVGLTMYMMFFQGAHPFVDRETNNLNMDRLQKGQWQEVKQEDAGFWGQFNPFAVGSQPDEPSIRREVLCIRRL